MNKQKKREKEKEKKRKKKTHSSTLRAIFKEQFDFLIERVVRFK